MYMSFEDEKQKLKFTDNAALKIILISFSPFLVKYLIYRLNFQFSNI